MSLLNLFKKEKTTQKESETFTTEPIKDLDHLNENGELPWGWLYKNKAFTDKINNEYSYFLDMWLNTRNMSPKEHYPALKSFVLYLEDSEKICKAQGECFEFWFYELIASKDYIAERKKELDELTANLDSLQEIYEKTLNIKSTVIILLKENDGILQSEFKKLFDDVYQTAVSNALYELQKEGKIEKIKSGRSYNLFYKG